MLDEFLKSNRSQLIDRCRAKVASRRAPRATPKELEHGVPLFLDQLTAMLAAGKGRPGDSPRTTSLAAAADSRLEDTASKHGQELLRHDFTIDQVVHDYGDLCQSITELAAEHGAPITVEEFGMLNIKLDNAIGSAVSEFARRNATILADEDALALNQRLGVLAGEMRNMLNTAILAISAIRGGSVGFGGATAAALDRSLIGMRRLIDQTLAEARIDADLAPSRESFEVAAFILDVQVAAALEASTRGCEVTVLPVEPGIFVTADRHIIASALANLLQNACSFARKDSHVLLRAYAKEGRVLIEVEDERGGLPEGSQEQLFRHFEQLGPQGDGAALGLSVSRKGVEASGGKLYVRNLPGSGCVFVIDLPQREAPRALPSGSTAA